MRRPVARVFKDPRKSEYLNAEGADRPLRSPIPHETLLAARGYRKRRIVEQVVAHDCTAILLYDPINIRYALDVSNMQVWAAHSPIHSALVFADGHAIDFEYQSTAHLAEGLETVDEVRPALAWFYMYSGREPGRVGRALGGRPRRDAARARRRGRAAPGGRQARPAGHRRPAPARRHAGRGPGADRAGAADQEPRRDRTHALDDPRVRGGHGADARALGRRAGQSRRSGPSSTTRTSARAASGSRRGSASPASAPTRGTRSAPTTSPSKATCWPSTPT